MSTKRGNIEADENFLRSVALPEATDTYTVIAHGTIIDKVREELTKNGFNIDNEIYITSVDGQIALCKVYLQCDRDPDMGMIFTWWNSYNKRVKFGCAVGSFIYDNQASLIGSEGMSWIRKHTGTADTEADSILEQLIEAANDYFDKIIAEKNKMKAMPLSVEDYGCIMGALYFEHELITPTQASAIIHERKKPTHNYSDRDTLWGLYKILMFGIEGMDITKWVKSQQKLHHMIMAEYAIKVELPADKVLIDNTVEIEADEEPIMFENKEAFVDQIVKQFQVDNPLAEYFANNHFDAIKTAKENMDAFAKYTENTATPAKQLSEEQIELVKEEVGDTLSREEIEDLEDAKEALFSWRYRVTETYKTGGEVLYHVEMKDDTRDLGNYTEKELIELAKEKQRDFSMDEDEDEDMEIEESIAQDEAAVAEVCDPGPFGDEDHIDGIDEIPDSESDDLLNDFEDVVDTDDFVFPTDLDTLGDGLEVPEEITEQAKEIEATMTKLYGSVKPYQIKDSNNHTIVTIDETLESFYI